MKVFSILVALFVFVAGQAVPIVSRASAPVQAVRFPNGKTIQAEVADTPEKRSRGLMFRDRLPEGGGMLFIFPRPQPYRFWMKNCRFPIDIIWLDAAKEVVHIKEDAPPCESDPCPTYGPKDKAALYVIEVAAGFAKEAGIRLGQSIHFD